MLLYLILVAQFQSFVDPVVILLAVPPGLSGVILTLWLSDTTLNVMSLMGVVMLVGIAVSNSILIVEFTRHLRGEGMDVREAVALACRVRLRPVLMTSLATIIGLLPMALKLGAGSEAYAPLARAILGGLGVSVVLTVFLVPAAYLLVHRARPSTPGGEVSLIMRVFRYLFLLSVVCSWQGALRAQPPTRLTLAQAQQLAIQNNPQFGAAKYNAAAAYQVAPQYRSAYAPSLQGSLTGVGADNGSRLAAGGLNNPVVYNRVGTGLSVGQMITDFGRTSNLVAMAKLQASAQDQVTETTRAQILLNTSRAYFAVLRAQAVMKVANQTVAARQLVSDQVTALAESKLKSTLDVSFANVNLADAKLLVVQAQNDLKAAEADLAAAMGLPNESGFVLEEEPMPPPLPDRIERPDA